MNSQGKKWFYPFMVSMVVAMSLPAIAEQVQLAEKKSDPIDFLRVSQSINLGDRLVTADFYTGFEGGRVTVANETSYHVRLSSYKRYVAMIAPNDTFSVPCEQGQVAGQLQFPSATGMWT